MVFPSLMTQIDSGIASQFSTVAVLIFSFLLNKMKKIALFALALLALLSLVYSKKIFSATYYPGGCGTLCMANQRYYGPPQGVQPPIYYYPSLQQHALFGPTQYYFSPYGPSPYQPTDCVQCMLQYQQYTAPQFGIQSNMGFTYNP
jgi:hypothetical protein